jgi:hypothetical protein
MAYSVLGDEPQARRATTVAWNGSPYSRTGSKPVAVSIPRSAERLIPQYQLA